MTEVITIATEEQVCIPFLCLGVCNTSFLLFHLPDLIIRLKLNIFYCRTILNCLHLLCVLPPFQTTAVEHELQQNCGQCSTPLRSNGELIDNVMEK
jgi:hypothetical protein